MAPYQVLKFYCYTPIADIHAEQRAHQKQGTQLGLTGRIKVAPEGINGTLSGRSQDCEAYLNYLKKDPRFATLHTSQAPSPSQVHQKLQVKLKKEIVRVDLPDIMPSPNLKERCYITPQAFQKIRQDPNVQVIDVRSNYEHRLGKFENAITFDIQNFREFPAAVDATTLDPQKTYIVCCTGGIKSEKARDYLKLKKNLPHVLHLQDGVIGYGTQTDGSGYQGVCYVFDERLTLPINRKNPTLISQCHHCQTPSARMSNCANPDCNLHTPMCAPCSTQLEGACSTTCQNAEKKRPYDGTGYYAKKNNTRDKNV